VTDEQVEAEARRLYESIQSRSWAHVPESIKDIWRDEARVQLAKETGNQ